MDKNDIWSKRTWRGLVRIRLANEKDSKKLHDMLHDSIADIDIAEERMLILLDEKDNIIGYRDWDEDTNLACVSEADAYIQNSYRGKRLFPALLLLNMLKTAECTKWKFLVFTYRETYENVLLSIKRIAKELKLGHEMTEDDIQKMKVGVYKLDRDKRTPGEFKAEIEKLLFKMGWDKMP